MGGPLSFLNRSAPLIAAALLLGLLLTRPFEVRDLPGTDRYFAEVRRRIEAIPYKIGPWLGKDVEVSVAAVRLLRPNKLMQRQYTDQETGRVLQLLVVHCGDTRDMRGHYPPVCYPAHGWRTIASRETTVTVDHAALPAKVYDFARVVGGVENRMSVVNLFVVPRPEGAFFSDIDALERASQDIRGAGLGAAQIQIVSVGDDQTRADESDINRFFDSLEPVLRAISERAPHHGS